MVVLKRTAYDAIANKHGHYTCEKRAHAAGIGMGTVSRIQRGAPVGSRVIGKLMAAYDCAFDDLFETNPSAPVESAA